jgi:hypothetical protein
MVAYGWRYTYRGHASELFPDADAAVRDLVTHYPASEPFATYLLTLEAMQDTASEVRPGEVGLENEEAWPSNSGSPRSAMSGRALASGQGHLATSRVMSRRRPLLTM